MSAISYGFITGIIFGFLLQKGRVVRYDKQIGALLLKDMTIVKFMFTSVIVGMAGIYILKDLGLVKLSLKATVLGGNIIGGLLFGIGWGLFGYCPGTAVGALGEGRWDVLWGLIGMLVGAGIYAEAFPLMKKTVLTWGNYGKISLPEVFGVNHWLVILIIWILAILMFLWFEKKRL